MIRGTRWRLRSQCWDPASQVKGNQSEPWLHLSKPTAGLKKSCMGEGEGGPCTSPAGRQLGKEVKVCVLKNGNWSQISLV